MKLTSPAEEREQTRSVVATGLLMLTGPIVWAAHFLVVYGAHTVACSQKSSGEGSAAVVGGATAIALAVLAFATWQSSGRASPDRQSEQVGKFLRVTTILLIALSAFAIALIGSTVLFLPPCLAFR